MSLRHLMSCFAAILTVALAACTSVPPSLEQMRAESAHAQLPHQPGEGKAVVYVVFEEANYEQVEFEVFLDDQQPASEVGRNHGGQYFYFELAPGEHKIFSRSRSEKLAKQAELALAAGAGEVIFIRQKLHFGVLGAGVELMQLDEIEGKYYVSRLQPGLAVTPMAASAPSISPASPVAPAADTFIGTVTGGNLAKGVGFSNLNVKLIVTPTTGDPVTFFVRADSKVFDVSGKQVDYKDSFRMYKKRVEIEHFVIRDATGGLPGRSDFPYEIGLKGVRTLRVLGQ